MKALLPINLISLTLRSLNEKYPWLLKVIYSTVICCFCFSSFLYSAGPMPEFHTSAGLLAANHSHRKNVLPSGERILRRVDAAKSKKIYGSYIKSIFYDQDGDYEAALREIRRVKKMDSESVHVRLKIAAFLIRQGKIEEAEKELKSAKKIDPDNIDLSLSLIFLYSYLQKDEALEREYGDFLENAHKVKPGNIRISEYLAQFYFYKQRPRDAIKVYETIVAGNPEYIEGIFWLGYLYSEVGRRQDAVKTWLQVIAIDPEHAPSLNSLAYTYAEEGINLKEAEKMIKKALEKDPQNGAYLDTLAWIYFKTGRYVLARKNLEQALNFLKDPIVYEHLGDVAVAEDNMNEAVEYYRQGLDSFPDNTALKDKLEKYGKKSKTIKK